MKPLLPDNWPQLSPKLIAGLAPFQLISHPILDNSGVSVYLKREDLLHPLLGGNKVYKLAGHLQEWRESGRTNSLASFGGAYSNHLLALAAAGEALAVPTIGVVRGERPKTLSPTLHDAESLGMKLHFVTRQDYRDRNNSELLKQLNVAFGEPYWIPEGGGGVPGLWGCSMLAERMCELKNINVVCHACGTGTSLAGLIKGVLPSVKVLGIPVVKGDLAPMSSAITGYLATNRSSIPQWQLLAGFECGGYAKLPLYLSEFILDFYEKTGIPLDAVYTAKLMRAVLELAKQGYWCPGTQVVAIHSGGLQGNRGFKQLELFRI